MTIAEPTIHTDHHHPETTIATTSTIAADSPPTLELPFGAGAVTIDAQRGVPLQFTDAASPERTFLLDSSIAWHSLEHAWGTGYIVGDGFAGRWNTPSELDINGARITAHHDIAGRIAVDVERTAGDTFRETYRFTNTTRDVVRVSSLGIQTPFADLYPGAQDALTRRIHAHIFTGGSWAWVAAQPMSGVGRILGLILHTGSLAAYSIETRNSNTISNARGHIVLHATDHARNPDAFGGQDVLTLEPGAAYEISWQLTWYDTMDEFIGATQPPGHFSALSATVGEPIELSTSHEVTAANGLRITRTDRGVVLTAAEPGLYWVRLGDSARTEVLFHESVETTIRKRAQYVVNHQRSTERPGLLANALVPVDTRTGLTQTTNGWSDWTDGSERIGVALMLQHGLNRGWLDADVDAVLEGWAAFARRYLIDDTAAPRRGSQDQHTGIRLYDSPWLAHFFLLRWQHHRRADDLELAARLIERAFTLGAGRYLTIGFSEIAVAVASALSAEGQEARAGALRDQVIASANHFAEVGIDLPGHEVAYEQSIVAPLLNVLIDGYRLSRDPRLLTAIKARLPWLRAFAAPQPHARLHGIAIRHWDGYWFGQRRQWGDVFPHYWSALSATVLLRLPEELRNDETAQGAQAILRANMANYFPDGSATCAFVMPSSVDGIPAHQADPLANDQDFHLAIWLQLDADGETVVV